ncbi:MAG: helix-turn-helix transcriptional regulator [Bacteroidales bacterium]|nr:helix-turn-helix transcriptional regulator [Bacteroidales bacterium]
MKTIDLTFKDMVSQIPSDIKMEVDLSFAIAKRLDCMISKHGLSKKEFAEAIGKRPSEVTKWLSGQHNFTIKTIAMISAYFEESMIIVPENV